MDKIQFESDLIEFLKEHGVVSFDIEHINSLKIELGVDMTPVVEIKYLTVFDKKRTLKDIVGED